MVIFCTQRENYLGVSVRDVEDMNVHVSGTSILHTTRDMNVYMVPYIIINIFLLSLLIQHLFFFSFSFLFPF